MERKPVDWEGVERDYRAGLATLRQIAETYGCSHTLINRRAKAEKWSRDLSARIAEAAKSLVSKSHAADVSKKATEQQIVSSNAQIVAAALISEQASIKRNRNLSEKLLNELEAQCDNPDLLTQLGDLMRSQDDRGTDKLNDVYRKVISLPSRIDGAKKLAETLRILVSLEREAYGMDKGDPIGADAVVEIVRRIVG